MEMQLSTYVNLIDWCKIYGQNPLLWDYGGVMKVDLTKNMLTWWQTISSHGFQSSFFPHLLYWRAT